MRRSPEALKRDAFVSSMLKRAIERGQHEQVNTGWTPPDASGLVDATCRFVVEQTVSEVLERVRYRLSRRLPADTQAAMNKAIDKLRAEFAPEVLDAR